MEPTLAGRRHMISTWRLYANGRDIFFGLSSELPSAGRCSDLFYCMDTAAWKVYTGSAWADYMQSAGGESLVGSAIVGTALAG